MWLKGETSGNFQHIVSITADCDMDALVIRVIKDGPACHLGNDSCFTNQIFISDSSSDDPDVSKKKEGSFHLSDLFLLLKQRKEERPQGSYTSYLFDKGIDKILKKVGEECTEVIIAAKAEDRKETIYEIADLCYHVLVLMAEQGIAPDEISEELRSRHIIDHKIKQEKMT